MQHIWISTHYLVPPVSVSSASNYKRLNIIIVTSQALNERNLLFFLGEAVDTNCCISPLAHHVF
jgi:hypothetical protein